MSKLIDIEGKHPPFDCAAGMAEGLLASGKFKRYEPVTAQQKHQDIQWGVRLGHRYEDVRDAPCITYNCRSCGNGGFLTGPTCHKTQVARCCGGVTPVPRDIAEQFAKLRKAWEPNHRAYLESKERARKEKELKDRLVLQEENRLLAAKLRMQSRPPETL